MAKEITIEVKIEKTFDAFPGVDHVWTDETEVYFDERANCRKVSRSEFFTTKTAKSANNGK